MKSFAQAAIVLSSYLLLFCAACASVQAVPAGGLTSIASASQPDTLAASPLFTSTVAAQTPEGVQTVEAGKPTTASVELHESEAVLSPTGHWVAEVHTDLPSRDQPASDTFHTELRVRSVQDETVYTPISEERNYGLGYQTPTVVDWSFEGRYLYFSERVHADGCAPFPSLSGLWRLDTQNGEVDEVLATSRTLALSPYQKWVAYVDRAASTDGERSTTTMTILDINSRESHEIDLLLASVPNPSFAQVDTANSTILWSPEGETFAVTIAHNPCRINNYWSHSVYTVDLETMTANRLIHIDSDRPIAQSWPTATSLLVRDKYGKQKTFDMISRQISTEVEPMVSISKEPEIRSITFLTDNILLEPQDPSVTIPTGEKHIILREDEIELSLENGQRMRLVNDNEGVSASIFSYSGYNKLINSHQFSIAYWEWGETLLIDAENGEHTFINGRLYFTPDKRWLLSIDGGGERPLKVYAWQILDGKLEFKSMMNFGYSPNGQYLTGHSAKWLSQNKLALDLEFTTQIDPARLTFDVSGNEVTITYNEEPIKQPLFGSIGDVIEDVFVAFEGQPLYRDESYLFTKVPSFLVDQKYFLMRNGNMRDDDPVYVSFELGRAATLYAAVDAEACELPAWMDDWAETDYTLDTTDIPMKLYRKEYPAGEVALGGNWMEPAACIRNHYILFVVE